MMHVFIRTTANGNEYWDKVGKRTVFVPAGVNPEFDVVENPKAILNKGDAKVLNQVSNAKLKEEVVDLYTMGDEQLRAYALEKGVELPANIKKEESIRKFIEKQLSAADDQ